MIILDPASLDEALDMKGDAPEAVPLAGGTDLMPLWSREGSKPGKILSLYSCRVLRAIHVNEDGLILGACATHADVAGHGAVVQRFPALARAAASIGAPAIRNMGTVGGNLVTASPAADLPPVLMVYGAEVRMASKRKGTRSVSMEDFFKAYRTTALEPDELLTGVRIPYPDDRARSFFKKVGARRAQACAKASLALLTVLSGSRIERFRAAAGSVAPVPLRLGTAESFVTGKTLTPELALAAGEKAASEVSPIDDIRSTASYRRFVLGALLSEGLRRIMARIAPEKS